MVPALTQEQFISRSKERYPNKFGYERASYKTYCLDKVTLLCLTCNEEFSILPSNHLKKGGLGGCLKCRNDLQQKERAVPQHIFLEKARSVHGDKYEYDLTGYVNCRSKISVTCKECKQIFVKAAFCITRGDGCTHCSFKTKCAKLTKPQEVFIAQAKEIHGDKYDYSQTIYKNKRTNVVIKCNKCLTEFTCAPSNHLGGTGCIRCRFSKGEAAVESALMDLDIQFKRQHRFSNCRHKYTLPFDFYIPSLKIAIEYDGRQHFASDEFFGGEKAFEECKIRDGIKNRYCEANGIKLLRIPYTEKDIKGCIERFFASL